MNVISIAIVIAWIAGIVGWVMNIVTIIGTLMASGDSAITVTGMLIARVIGIFVFPLGGVLGYF